MGRFKLLGSRKILSHGGSAVISLPPKALEILGKKEGDEVAIIIDETYRNVIIKNPEDINITASGLSEKISLEFTLPEDLKDEL